MATGFLFDCDGVLVDSERLSCGAWLPVLARHGIAATLPDILPFLGKSSQAVLEHFRTVSGQSLPDDLPDEKEAEYMRSAAGRLASFPGLDRALSHLVALRYPVAVASSGSHEKIRFSLREARLTDFFPVICSVADVERGKPEPDLFLYAATRLSLPSADCIVVEDTTVGIEAARRAGMRALGFAGTFPAAALRDAGAWHVFDDWRAFLPLLKAEGAL